MPISIRRKPRTNRGRDRCSAVCKPAGNWRSRSRRAQFWTWAVPSDGVRLRSPSRPRNWCLGIDLNFAMLRLASEVLRTGRVSYPRRRVGVVYDRREFPARFANAESVDFWACDAAALPFPAGTFSLAVNMNVLDCVSSPGRPANLRRPACCAAAASSC